MFDTIIRNGFVVDGTGNPGRAEDVAVTGDSIAATGVLEHAQAAEVVDAAGMYVCPGFIDIHAHSDFNVLVAPPGQSKIRQGVTTEVCGNCGMSAAPLYGSAREQRQRSLRALGLAVTWSTLDEFVRLLRDGRLLANIAPLVGHGNIRASVIGYEARAPEPGELARMTALLRSEMESGAWGLSSGLVYPPGVFADERELVELAGIVARFGGMYASHIRSEGGSVLEAVAEAIRIGKQAGVPVQISHLKTMEKRNWHKLPAVLDMIEHGIAEGVAVAADRYPYTASSTGLDAVLPPWACRGGAGPELERLRSPSLRDRMFAAVTETMPEEELSQSIVISRVVSEANKHCEGLSLARIADLRGQPVKDALFDLLVEEELEVDAVCFCMSEANLTEILGREYVMVGSDAAVWDVSGPLSVGKPHPRAFGTFPRILETYVFDRGVLRLEEAVHKMTGQPARRMQLTDRGVIARGCRADIVLFKPGQLHDRATYADPHAYPSGITRVMVNGRWVVQDGALTGESPGRLLLKN